MIINDIKVLKKDGNLVDYDVRKLIDASFKSADRVDDPFRDVEVKEFVDVAEGMIIDLFDEDMVVSVNDLHRIAELSLSKVRPDIASEYKRYRNYKVDYANSLMDINDEGNGLKYGVKTENAHKDNELIATQRSLFAEKSMKEVMKMFIFKPKWLKAQDEGFIHVHDFGDRWTQTFNCCLFDASNVIRYKEEKGYSYMLNGVKHQQPKEVDTAIGIIIDLVLSASSNQYGGFTVGELDTIIAPYAEKTYHTYLAQYSEDLGTGKENHDKAKKMAHRETMKKLRQGYQSLEFRLNTLSNALGQTPQQMTR